MGTRLLVALMALLLSAVCCRAQEQGPRTVAEASGFTQTATGAEVDAFLKELAEKSPRVRLSSIGKTNEGREIPLAIIADPPVESPEDATKGGRLTVLFFGGIHSGESDGKEALLAIARQLALYKKPSGKEEPAADDAWKAMALRRLVVLVVPNYNADGNEQRSPDNRPGQVGPEIMGERENAQGFDLNRDFVKLEAPETRALIKAINRWDPAIIVDTHTTNGSLHRYPMTYDGPKNPAGDQQVLDYAFDVMMPAFVEGMQQRQKIDMFWYGNFERDHTRWESYPDLPRYGVNYFGMRNRFGILTESYAYDTYETRVRAQEAFIKEILRFAAEHHGKIRSVIRAADERASRWSEKEQKIPVATSLAPLEGKVKVLGYEESRIDGKLVKGEPKEYEVELYRRYAPEIEVSRPWAYVIPADHKRIVENLRLHGVAVELLREDVELDVEAQKIEAVTAASRPFQGHTLVSVKTSTKAEPRQVFAGSYIVKTTQPLGAIAVYLLEPQSADGLTTWNFFDESLKIDQEFPVLRLPQRTSLITSELPEFWGEEQEKKPITFDEAYESGRRISLGGSPVGGLSWLEDGEHYLQVRDGRLMKVAAATGRSEAFTNAEPMIKALAKLPTIGRKTAEGMARGPFYRTDKERTVALFDHANDLYYAKLDGSEAARLTATPEEEEFATFSPDGEFVAFVRNNDLWVVDLATRTERALTTGGTDLIRNAKHTWVYYEELYGRNWQAYWWSPDSSRIAFLQEDATPIKTFTLVNDAKDGDQGVEVSPYPKPGEPNPRVKLFTVTVAGGGPREVNLSNYSPEDMLITKLAWWPDSSALACFVSNRVQTWSDMLSCPPDGGTPRRLFRDKTEAWVEPPAILEFRKDGSFIMSSERSGWQHLYAHEKDGKLKGPITQGEWEVRNLKRFDEASGWIYFGATKDSHIAENLYRVKLDGGDIERLTLEPGSHRTDVSPGGKYFTDSWSSRSEPTQVALRSAEDGSLVRRLDINPVWDLERYRVAPSELVQIPMQDGFVLEGAVIRPPDFDPTKKYPVWLMTYAGPHAPTVTDSWSSSTWDQALASEGFMVFRVDPRSASGKGAVSAWAAYKQLGVRELEDLEAAAEWLCTQYPWADKDRIGIAGHSYGGFMTAYALTHSQAFAAGISGAPVTDWRDYDSIYTERFMLTPQENPEGYDATSAVKGAGKLHGKLMLVHGMMDDNVHAQNSMRLIRALHSAGKQFEMMVYPENRHGIGGRHYQRLQWDFIMRTLGGPREESVSESPDTQVAR